MGLTRQQKEFYRTFSRHGSGDALVEIQPNEVILLAHIAYSDIHRIRPEWTIPTFEHVSSQEFYSITPDIIDSLPQATVEDAVNILSLSGAMDPNNIIYLYLKNLSELYRRRYKFYHILKTQPFPKVDQIGLRCLLEYGNCDDSLLFAWMCWRKLIYDIDNRSAQETGYLFEPIMASCLGGEPVSHKHSPVKRIDDNGRITTEGRQIDCYIEEKREVYELKLRVTIAASGQGRFGEEMSFPHEAHRAGLKPILIVFDPTPSQLLDKLKEKYVSEGGSYAIGEDAWNVLTNQAGTEMGTFILKYIKPPIMKMEEAHIDIPMNIHLSATTEHITLQNDAGISYSILRKEATESI